ncbi:MAG: lipopolysaccharide biosynthesis protein [Actinomycetota bacterium]|nr:lipopolysaccharide biosynthesis protein [Actinomycetota bacterium]
MSSLFKRLVSSLAAYQIADLVAKFSAVLLLPLYTRYINPSGYGTIELLANGVIFVSILIRFGMIEAFLRFYFSDQDPERRAALVRRAFLFLLLTTTVAALVLLALAGPLSRLVLARRDAPIFRIAVLGLWSFTNLELAYGLLRVQERIRTYALASVANVLMTIVGAVVLVVALHRGPRGYLLGNYGASSVVLLALWWALRAQLRSPAGGGVRRAAYGAADRLRALLSFGLPTVPAELSVYGLSIVDRYYLYHSQGSGVVGLYSIAIKLAGSVAFIVRGFQYAWPPLAYSVTDDAQAARLYGLVTTYYLLASGWVVAGLALLGRWIIRLLTTHSFFGAYRALPWVALGWAMYGLWVVFLVIAGRAKVTKRNFPAALAGLIANVALIVLLVPPLGIAGAGIALCGAYMAMLAVMHLLTRRAFTVAFEWRRLIQLAVVIGGLAVGGNLLLPTRGIVGLLSRVAVLLAIPLALLLTRFAHPAELRSAGALIGRLRGGAAGGQA